MTELSIVDAFYAALTAGNHKTAATLLAEDVTWCAAHPINDLKGRDAFFSDYWSLLISALPDIERRPLMTVVGDYEGGRWVVSQGFLCGTFEAPLCDIPPTDRSLYLRFGEITRVADGKIQSSHVFLDFLNAMDQAGVNPTRLSPGHPGQILPPMTLDGLDRSGRDMADSDKSMRLVLDMIAGLLRYDGKSLFSMDQELYWHEDFMWYGPGGIGTTRGLKGFRAHHQGPFLKAFPDRDVDRDLCWIAEGNWVATGGWPHMSGTHTGDDWMGLEATGKPVTMRVMDIWRREGDRLAENWVSIDIIHIMLQLGTDVFADMRALAPPKDLRTHD